MLTLVQMFTKVTTVQSGVSVSPLMANSTLPVAKMELLRCGRTAKVHLDFGAQREKVER
jgi:hypothetical protein